MDFKARSRAMLEALFPQRDSGPRDGALEMLLLATSIAITVLGFALPVPAEEVGRTEISATDEVLLTYLARHRDTVELLEILGPVLPATVLASADPASDSLVLRGPEPDIQAVVETLRELDRSPRSLVLHYAAVDPNEAGDALLGKLASRADPTWRVLPLPDERGAERRATRTIAARAGSSREFVGTLRLLEGTTARLFSIRTVELRRLGLAWLGGVAVGHDDPVELVSGIEARALVLPDGRIRLRLRAFLSGGENPAQDRRETVAETVVRLDPDTPLLVAAAGGRPGATPSGVRGAFGGEAREEPRALLLSLSVEGEQGASPRPRPE